MKKIVALGLCIAALLALTSCAKFTCSLCKKEKTGKMYIVEGTDIKYCEDCYKTISGGKD